VRYEDEPNPEMLDRGMMTGFGSPDEVGKRNTGQLSEILTQLSATAWSSLDSTYSEFLTDTGAELLLSNTHSLRSLLDLQSMLVSSGCEDDLAVRTS